MSSYSDLSSAYALIAYVEDNLNVDVVFFLSEPVTSNCLKLCL